MTDLHIPIAASQLLPAREQMAFTLGFHIILASLGIAFPTMMLIANYVGLRRKDPVALELAQRWSSRSPPRASGASRDRCWPSRAELARCCRPSARR